MEDAAGEWGIEYTYVNDPELATWGEYGLTSHPSFALINADGSLHDSGAGVVNTDSTVEWIESQLGE